MHGLHAWFSVFISANCADPKSKALANQPAGSGESDHIATAGTTRHTNQDQCCKFVMQHHALCAAQHAQWAVPKRAPIS